MHTPEHNPFIQSQSTPLDFTYLPGGDTDVFDSFTGSFDLPYMQYTGIQDNILSALNNVLNFSGQGPLNPFANAVLSADTPIHPLGDITFDAENIVYDEGDLYYDFEEGLPNQYNSIGTWYNNDGELVQGPVWFSGGQWTNMDGLSIPTPLEYQNMELTSDVDFSNIFSGLGSTNIFDEESLAATLSQISDGDTIKAAEVKALTPEMLEKTTSEYYDPYEQAERDKAIDTLGTRIGGVSTGGFAGSGGRQAGLSGAESLYRDDYKDIIADIQKLRGSATTDVLDTIYGWQELMSDPYGS